MTFIRGRTVLLLYKVMLLASLGYSSDHSRWSIGHQPWKIHQEGASVTSRGIGHQQNHYIIAGSTQGLRLVWGGSQGKNIISICLPTAISCVSVANRRVVSSKIHTSKDVPQNKVAKDKMCLLYFSKARTIEQGETLHITDSKETICNVICGGDVVGLGSLSETGKKKSI